jgi:hypothetical protein
MMHESQQDLYWGAKAANSPLFLTRAAFALDVMCSS